MAALATAAQAGASVSNAPTLAYATLTTGGGGVIDFWRLPAFAGDQVTFRADIPWPSPNTRLSFSVFTPGVDDYTFGGAVAVATFNTEYDAGSDKEQFTLKIPFTGLGTLAVCEGDYHDNNCATPNFPTWPMDTYSFTATDVHAVSVRLSGPTLARRGSQMRLVAHLASPAGVPSGHCIFSHSRPIPAVAGQCVGKLRATRRRSQRVGVQFMPDDGWSAGSAHRTIRLY